MLRLKFTGASDNKWRYIIYTKEEGVVMLTSPTYDSFKAAEAMAVHFLMHVGVMPAQYASLLTGEYRVAFAEEEMGS